MKRGLISVLPRTTLPSLLIVGLCRSALAFPCPNVPCPLPGKDSQTFLTVDKVAPPIFHELQRRFGDPPGNGIDMEARESDWQETDVTFEGDPVHSMRRFIQAGHDGSRWYVWYELGGIGYSIQIAIFDLPAGAQKPVLVIHTVAFDAKTLCPMTRDHLNDPAEGPEDTLLW
jgi:hypothetical protein